ncbi:hypothetical protein GJV85_09735 [Sulfurimonas aquatica]|uniref:Uncharacterized protein n=1 Tax=Sulfurimonas aquatica TaxID=2672570 RepID=A0A975B1A6_9BACT|nr:hypothetical protein [Sulfurimonas aquatica]QSZ42374.1 hypothetical protein GJV85_09735 [Sulfurimonas aquatica]
MQKLLSMLEFAVSVARKSPWGMYPKGIAKSLLAFAPQGRKQIFALNCTA